MKKNIEKAAEIIVNATGKAVKSEKVANVTEKIKSANITDIAKKSVAAAKETVDIFKSQKVLAKLQKAGKITQDILDALICDKKENLEKSAAHRIVTKI